MQARGIFKQDPEAPLIGISQFVSFNEYSQTD